MRLILVFSATALLFCGDDAPEEETGDGGNHEVVEDMTPDQDTSSDPDAGISDGGDARCCDGDAATVDPDLSGDLVGEPPTWRSIIISINDDDFSSEANISSADESRIIPIVVDAEFRVFVIDDLTLGEDLIVDVVENDDTVIEQTVEFRNGLWRISTRLVPGNCYRVRTEDGDGHVILSEHELCILSRDASAIGAWTRRWYTEGEQSVTRTQSFTVNDDMTWSDSYSDRDLERTGRYEFLDDGNLLIEVRTSSGSAEASDDDEDSETVEVATRGAFYVDQTYLDFQPWLRTAPGEDVAGSWERSWEVLMPGDGGDLEVVETWTEALELIEGVGEDDPGTWTGSQTITPAEGAEIVSSWAGHWEIEINEDYTESVGNFLVRTVEEQDDEALEEPFDVWFELYAERADTLVIVPLLRNEE
jgi:hypothetical protein